MIIVGRGGGSIEDLWAFNDERVVRAIVACPVPVISAVGHETDTTLADYAADLRAPTPSAAAELVSAHYDETAELVFQYRRRLARCIQYLLAERRARLGRCVSSWGMRKPQERLSMAEQRLDDLNEALGFRIQRQLAQRAQRLERTQDRLQRANPLRRVEALSNRVAHAQARLVAGGPSRWAPRLALSAQKLEQFQYRLVAITEAHAQRQMWRLEAACKRLESSNPEAILQRGYSVVTHGKRERVITHPDQVREGEIIHIRSAGGRWRGVALSPQEDLLDQIE